jgi:4-amino-4-deoxy-L-arabinose transferase-like glycosyltransferase
MLKDKIITRMIHCHGAAVIVAVVTIICLVPFANKAFHIDDPLFLWAAKHIQGNPADFYGFSVNWYGWEMPMAEVMKNPPVACYYAALAGWLFGWDEITMHIAFLVPAAAAALGAYYLARKLCSRPALAALAAVLTPGFLVSSTNIMCDTMMLAFWVWAVFLWLKGIESDRYLSLFFAAVLVAICALTKYYGMALLPLLLAYSLMKRRRVGIWILFLLVPAVILAGYQWMTYNLYGRGLLSDAAAYATEHSWEEGLKLISKGLIGLFFAGGCAATALFYSPLLWSKRTLICGTALTILFILALSSVEKIGVASTHDENGIRWTFLVQAGLMAAGGVSILALTGADFWRFRNAESLLLLLWVYGTFIFAGFINWTVNARSILPMAPAIGILLMRRVDRHGTRPAQRVRMWRAAWPLAPAAAVALLVCLADYIWANTARFAAVEINRKFRSSHRTLWFQGHWGFQYYMEAAGAKAFDFENPKIAQGDIVLLPSGNTNVRPLPEETARLNRVFQFNSYWKITTLNLRLGAGFYSEVIGPLPFVAGPVAPRRYYAFIIQ